MGAKVLLTDKNSSWGIIQNPNSPDEFPHIVQFPDELLKKEFISLELFGNVDFDWEAKLETQPEFGFTQITDTTAKIVIRQKDYPDKSVMELMNKDYAIVKENGFISYWSLENTTYDGEGNIEYVGHLDIPFTFNPLYHLKNEFILEKTQIKDEYQNGSSFESEVNKIVSLTKLEKENYEGNDTNLKFLYYKKQLIEENGLMIENQPASYLEVSLLAQSYTNPNFDSWELDLLGGFNTYKYFYIEYSLNANQADQAYYKDTFENLQLNVEYSLKSGDIKFKFTDGNKIVFYGNSSYLKIFEMNTNNGNVVDGIAIPAPFTLHVIPLTKNNRYNVNGNLYNTSEVIKDMPDDSSVIEAKVLEYNPFIYSNDINDIETYYDADNTLIINYSSNDINNPQIENESGILKINFINTSYTDLTNIYNIDLSQFKIEGLEEQIYQTGAVDLVFGYYNGEKTMKVPYDLFKEGNMSIQMRLETLDTLSYNIDILNYSQGEIGIKEISQDFPFDTSNWEEYKTNNKGTRILKWIGMGLLGIGLGSVGYKGYKHWKKRNLNLKLANESIKTLSLLNPYEDSRPIENLIDKRVETAETHQNSALSSVLKVGVGTIAIPTLYGSRINMKNQPHEVVEANTQTSINLIQMNNFLSIWLEVPQNDNYLKSINTEIKRSGVDLGLFVYSPFEYGEKKYYQSFTIADIFENIDLQVSNGIKQEISSMFEGGTQVWYYRNRDDWKGIKNYQVDNVFID